MLDSDALGSYEISKQAFCGFREWKRLFVGKLRESAIELARGHGGQVVVTPRILAQAVRLTCEEVAAEADALDFQEESPDEPRSRVA
jgi:hypothetical protein